MTPNTKHVFLIAAEDSGDALGADVIDELRRLRPDIRISGIGGARMRERGAHSDVDMSGLAVVGLIEGVKAYKRVKQAVVDTTAVVMKADPDAVVLIDSWGFMWRVAQALKLGGARAKRIKLIGPQVWATRPGRARVLAKWVDHLICIHPFEQPFYVKWGLPTTVMGNPALHRLPKGDGARFRATHGIKPGERVIGLLPGSRPAEMRRVMPRLVEATERLCKAHPECRVVCMVASGVRDTVHEAAKTWTFPHILIDQEGEKADTYAAMDIAIACSGTVTTELAAQGAAVIACYRLGWITWALLRSILMNSKYAVLVNVAAQREIVPELIQTRFSVSNIVNHAEGLLRDPVKLAKQKQDQYDAIRVMKGEGRPAAIIAAETIMKLT